MLSKNKIKYINSLSVNKLRREQKAFTVEGTKLASELFASQFLSLFVCATQDWLDKHPGLIPEHIEVEVVLAHEMDKISQFNTAPGILAVAEIPDDESPLNLQLNELYLALDGISDPGNLGTILRTADWFGVQHIFTSNDSADAFNSKVVQASMGAIFRVKVHVVELDTILSKATQLQLPVMGAMMDGQNIYNMPSITGGVIVIGSESHGIRSELLDLLSSRITIPRFHSKETDRQSESLNAAIATSLILSEFRRKSI